MVQFTSGTSYPTIIVVPAVARRRLIGAAQGWLVAYIKIPSFIVTLGGHAGLPGPAPAHAAGTVRRPFPASSRAQLGLHPRRVRAARLPLDFDADRAGGAAVLLYSSVRRWQAARKGSMEMEPFALFYWQERRVCSPYYRGRPICCPHTRGFPTCSSRWARSYCSIPSSQHA